MTPYPQLASDQVSGGRHRRPETLADIQSRQARQARPVSAPRRAAASPAVHRRRATGRRGRHARPADPLAITVKPLTAALAGPGGPPVIGSHRAPGTLPIESWVLLGKPRQQALLGALVAVGLALVMIPVARHDSPVTTTVNASGQTVVSEGTAKTGDRSRPAAAGKPAKNGGGDAQQKEPATARPSSAAPQASAHSTPPAPEVRVPAGDGPFRSLRTTGSATVALTFDDGPDPVHTPEILSMLAEHDIKATFCLVGERVRKHPEVVRQIVAAGHTLCNHTWNHSLTIGEDTPERIRADLERTTAAIQAAAPGAKVPFFRAPGGNFSDVLVEVAYTEGMRSLYWEVDPRDWQHLEEEDDDQHVDRVVKDLQEQVRPGAIVLSHDFNQPDTIAAYRRLLPELKEKFDFGIPPGSPASPARTSSPEPPPPDAPPPGDDAATADR
jgi:peptidoglycan/xylan/chitin deacetylase (PgdA/CDA1 family)